MQTSHDSTGPTPSAEGDAPAHVGVRTIVTAIVAAMDVGLGCATGFGFDWWLADGARDDRHRRVSVVPADRRASR